MVKVNVCEHTLVWAVDWDHNFTRRVRLTDEVPIGVVGIAAHDDPTDVWHVRMAADWLWYPLRAARHEYEEQQRASYAHIETSYLATTFHAVGWTASVCATLGTSVFDW